MSPRTFIRGSRVPTLTNPRTAFLGKTHRENVLVLFEICNEKEKLRMFVIILHSYGNPPWRTTGVLRHTWVVPSEELLSINICCMTSYEKRTVGDLILHVSDLRLVDKLTSHASGFRLVGYQ